MAKYVNKQWGDLKYYYLSSNMHGTVTLKEYRNKVKATELVMTKDQAQTFLKRMKDNGWQEV